MIKTQKSSTKYNTIVNPETGKRITIGGNIYKRLVAEGKVMKPGSLPDIKEFVYLVDEDIWVRNKGPRFVGLMRSGYILLENERKIVKKTPYNSKKQDEKDNDIEIDTGAWKMIMSVVDVLSLILSNACLYDLTSYMRIRATCKLFRNVLDVTAPYRNLVTTKIERKRDNKVYRTSFRCLDKVPERVVKCYVELYPIIFVENLHIKGGTKWYDKLYKEEKYKKILDEAVQDKLVYYSGEKKPTYIHWRRIRYILARANQIPNPNTTIDIWFDYTQSKIGDIVIDDRYTEKKLSEWWELAKKHRK